MIDEAVIDGPAAPAGRTARDAAPGRGAAWLGWALLLVPMAAVLAICQYWEPVMRDGWGHRAWYRYNPHDLHGLFGFCRDAYFAENPRLGQLPTLLLYSDTPYHVIFTPLLELAVVVLLTAVALGRWPRPGRRDDALAALLIAATLAACAPQIGPMLLYRPFTWNYVFGFALNLAWLVPYRLSVVEPRPDRWWRAPLAFVLGALAGLCNEHTGIAFLAMGAAATLVAWRRAALRPWMIAGLVGLLAGYVVLLTAPAQNVRYAGLARHAGIVGRILDRGVAGNAWLFAALAAALAPALVLVAIGLVARRGTPRPADAGAGTAAPVATPVGMAMARASQAALAIGGSICALTLLASPKLGPRLYFASVALIAAGLVGWLMDQLVGPAARRARRVSAAIAAAVLVYVAIQLVVVHRVVGPLGAVRSERIEHSAIGAAVTVPRYPFGRSRYFLGDDLLDPAVRDVLSREFRLGSLGLEPERP